MTLLFIVMSTLGLYITLSFHVAVAPTYFQHHTKKMLGSLDPYVRLPNNTAEEQVCNSRDDNPLALP